jgi:hemerythrin-like metal-binding protein
MADSYSDTPFILPVGNAEIDAVHEELAELTQRLANAGDEVFSDYFEQLLSHTEEHFLLEERLMARSGFPHASEHSAEHRKMLAKMHLFSQRRPLIARAYVRDRLPERLNLHITRLDSQLAAYLRD